MSTVGPAYYFTVEYPGSFWLGSKILSQTKKPSVFWMSGAWL